MLALFILLSLMCFYVNTIFYAMSLLAVVLCLLFSLVSTYCVHTLTILVLLIVYVGAMIILIGYVCAISPNLITCTVAPFSPIFLASSALLLTSCVDPKQWLSPHRADFLRSFFYSSYGVVSFLTLIFILFITLLIVTSQYLAPRGPFRSLAM